MTKQVGLYVSWLHGIEYVSPAELMLWIMLQDNEASGCVSLSLPFLIHFTYIKKWQGGE